MTVRPNARETRSDEARARVLALFKLRGPTAADDPRNFDCLLRDTFAGQFGWQRRTLVAAAQEAIPARLRQMASGASQKIFLAQIVEHLRTSAAIDPIAARWAVEALASALFEAQQETAVDERPLEEVPGPERVPEETLLATLRRAESARTGAVIAAGAVVLALLLSLVLGR